MLLFLYSVSVHVSDPGGNRCQLSESGQGKTWWGMDAYPSSAFCKWTRSQKRLDFIPLYFSVFLAVTWLVGVFFSSQGIYQAYIHTDMIVSCTTSLSWLPNYKLLASQRICSVEELEALPAGTSHHWSPGGERCRKRKLLMIFCERSWSTQTSPRYRSSPKVCSKNFVTCMDMFYEM